MRRLPPDSSVVMRRELDMATYERVAAAPGEFSSNYGDYAIVFTRGPVHGQVTLNGARTRSSCHSRPLYSVLRPGDVIAGLLEKPTVYEVILITAKNVSRLLSPAASLEIRLASKLRVEAPRFLQCLWQRMTELLEANSSDASPLIKLCIELLLHNLVDNSFASPDRVMAHQHADALSRAVQFIDFHLAEHIDLQSISRVAGLSPSHFNRIFKAHHHISVHRFVLIRRLERVRKLLRETEQSIATVALEVGFSSQSHLTTAFRQRFAMTPAQYRIDCRRRHIRKFA